MATSEHPSHIPLCCLLRPSVQNFQLVGWDHSQGSDGQGNDLLLQFGRIDSQHFALDFAYPLSLHSAFAVALASIDSKLCYTI